MLSKSRLVGPQKLSSWSYTKVVIQHSPSYPPCWGPPQEVLDLGPAYSTPTAHSPSAGTQCRPWQPSGALWGSRAAASCTPGAATRRRLTAEARAGNTVTDHPRCPCPHGQFSQQVFLCSPFLLRTRKRTQREESRSQSLQASPSLSFVSLLWRIETMNLTLWRCDKS